MDKILLLFAIPAFGIAVAVGLAIIGWLSYNPTGWFLKVGIGGAGRWLRTKFNIPQARIPGHVVALLLIGLFMLGHAAVTHAVTSTPIPPTSTPVLLDIPVNTVLSSANGWISTFAPIAAIGIGIAIAMAVLGYLGKMIKGAFS